MRVLRDRIERWLPTAALLAVGAALVWNAVEGAGLRPSAALALGVLLTGGWWLSPLRRGRHVPHASTQADAGDDDLIVYWKPGCTYCIRLLAALDRVERDQIHWVNVWQDDDAARFVADHNNGDVLTPTVVTGAGRRLPMTTAAIGSHLAERRTR